MKRIIAIVLTLLIALTQFAYASDAPLDLSDLSPEQLEILKGQIDGMLATPEPDPGHRTISSALELLQALAEFGAPINLDSIMDYTRETDPNGQIGKPGAYTSKTDYGIIGYKDGQTGAPVGGTVEYFENTEYCVNRYNYLVSVWTAMPVLNDERAYQRGNVLLRVNDVIPDADAAKIVAAMDALGLPESVVQQLSQDEPMTINVPDNSNADTESTTQPAPTPEPVYIDIKKGDKGPDVVRIQARLKDLGFLTGSADGDFGGMTEKAVREFQGMNGLSITGIMGEQDQRIIFGATAKNIKGVVIQAMSPGENGSPTVISGVRLRSSYGTPYVQFSIKNIGPIVITAFTYEIEFYDAYGDRIVSYSSNSFVETYSGKLSEGKSASISTRNTSNYEIYGFEGAASVKVGIVRTLFGDGTDVNYYDDDIVWYEGK